MRWDDCCCVLGSPLPRPPAFLPSEWNGRIRYHRETTPTSPTLAIVDVRYGYC